MTNTPQALNVLTRTGHYHADAILIGNAYYFQDTLLRTGGRLDYLDQTGDPRGIDDVARAYVRTEQTDRRYRLHVLASTGHSAIVRYRGNRYRVDSRYHPEIKERTYYIYNA